MTASMGVKWIGCNARERGQSQTASISVQTIMNGAGWPGKEKDVQHLH
jgi:hypothetical protein